MRKILAAILFIALVLTATACGGNQSTGRHTSAHAQLEKGSQTFDDYRGAPDDSGAHASNPDSSGAHQPELRNESGRIHHNESYSPVTWDVIVDSFGEIRLMGNHFYIEAEVLSFWEDVDGIEHMLISSEFGFSTIKRGEAEDSWYRMEVGDWVIVYFELVGCLNYYDLDEPSGDEHFLSYLGWLDFTLYGAYEDFEYGDS